MEDEIRNPEGSITATIQPIPNLAPKKICEAVVLACESWLKAIDKEKENNNELL